MYHMKGVSQHFFEMDQYIGNFLQVLAQLTSNRMDLLVKIDVLEKTHD